MNLGVRIPTCPKCRGFLAAESFNLGDFTRCPMCGVRLWVEAFPALVRPVQRGSTGEAVMEPGESACFYHEGKKAVTVCESCGRFLCALCDCELNGQHLCPACLETGKKKGSIEQLANSRMLYGRQALMMALLPLFLTGLGALYLAIRYWKAPESLVQPRPWMMPTALVFAILQTLGFTILILWAIMS